MMTTYEPILYAMEHDTTTPDEAGPITITTNPEWFSPDWTLAYSLQPQIVWAGARRWVVFNETLEERGESEAHALTYAGGVRALWGVIADSHYANAETFEPPELTTDETRWPLAVIAHRGELWITDPGSITGLDVTVVAVITRMHPTIWRVHIPGTPGKPALTETHLSYATAAGVACQHIARSDLRYADYIVGLIRTQGTDGNPHHSLHDHLKRWR